MQSRLPTLACVAFTAILVGIAAPAAAQPGPPPPPYGGYAGGWQGTWVGRQGQVYQANPPFAADAPPPIDRSLTRDGWLDGCRRRLDAANQGHDAPANFIGACEGWLSYYEQMGYAANGYGFSYAIPVSVTTIPGHCEPCPREQRYFTPRRHLPRARPLSDKRIRLYQ